jgi:hypothetical protein
MSRVSNESLALGIDGPFLAPTLEIIRSARDLELAFPGWSSRGRRPSERAPFVLVAAGPPAIRSVSVVAVERRGDLITIRYRLAPRASLPRSVLLAAEERFAVGLATPEDVSPYHLVQLRDVPPHARFRFERELERSVLGWIEVRDGQVTLDEDALFAPIGGSPDRVRVIRGSFEGEVPLAWTANTPGVPLQLIAEPPAAKGRFTICDARAATSLARLRGMLVRVEGVVRRVRGSELFPERAWLVETGDQVYGQSALGRSSLAS